MTPDAVIVSIPVVMKARKDAAGRRLVEVEASCEVVDSEGDLVLQKALMDSADSFVRTGNLDLDHLSELGHRLGLANPESYIVGRPIEVKDLGGGRTGVVGEISQALDGSFDPKNRHYDAFWDSLMRTPPVVWQASIYGFPTEGMVQDCRYEKCDVPADRFLVKGIDWRSLAFTRNPINTSLKGTARIVTAKAFAAQLAKDYGRGMMQPMSMSWPTAYPRCLDDLWGQYQRHISRDCASTQGVDSVAGFKDHFIACGGVDPDTADLFAYALMYLLVRERKRAAERTAA